MNKKVIGLALGTLLFALSVSAHAQQPGKIFRIGYLDPGNASGSAVLVNAFRQELSKLGWNEGKNLSIEYRFAELKLERAPELVADLLRLKVDLIVVTGTVPASAAKGATSTVPIVMANVGDPVGVGLVASLARPGGNVTGLSGLSPELNTKRLELLKDAVPKLARIGLLQLTGATIASDLQLKELRAAALALKLKLEEIETQLDAKGFYSPLDAGHLTLGFGFDSPSYCLRHWPAGNWLRLRQISLWLKRNIHFGFSIFRLCYPRLEPRSKAPQVLDFGFLRKWTISSGRFPHPRPAGEGRGEGIHGQGRSIMIHDNWGRRRVKVTSSKRVSDSCSDNRQSKTCPEPCRRVQNPKWD